MWNLLGIFLGKNPLSRVLDTVDSSIDNETERTKIRAETVQNWTNRQAQVVQTQMQTKMFWRVWALFAVPLGIWWAMVMADTAFSFPFVVPDLPEAIKPWANQIFNSIFYSGGGVAGAQLLASAVSGWKK